MGCIAILEFIEESKNSISCKAIIVQSKVFCLSVISLLFQTGYEICFHLSLLLVSYLGIERRTVKFWETLN
jgi:hypothetical protein